MLERLRLAVARAGKDVHMLEAQRFRDVEWQFQGEELLEGRGEEIGRDELRRRQLRFVRPDDRGWLALRFLQGQSGRSREIALHLQPHGFEQASRHDAIVIHGRHYAADDAGHVAHVHDRNRELPAFRQSRQVPEKPLEQADDLFRPNAFVARGVGQHPLLDGQYGTQRRARFDGQDVGPHRHPKEQWILAGEFVDAFHEAFGELRRREDLGPAYCLGDDAIDEPKNCVLLAISRVLQYPFDAGIERFELGTLARQHGPGERGPKIVPAKRPPGELRVQSLRPRRNERRRRGRL